MTTITGKIARSHTRIIIEEKLSLINTAQEQVNLPNFFIERLTYVTKRQINRTQLC
jgi:hypothetical protein